jgi:transposase
MKSLLRGAIGVKNSTARKLAQVPAGYLLVGTDPHKKQHAVVIMSQDAVIKRKFRFTNSREGFTEVMQRIAEEVNKTGSNGAMFAIEAGSHYWRNLAYYLDQQKVLFRLVSPFTLKRRREGEDLNRRKNDYRDAEMAAELLRTGKFMNNRLLYGIYAEIRAAYTNYQRLVEDKTAQINLLKSRLDNLFPEFTTIFKDPCGKTAMVVLAQCAMPKVIARMKLADFIQMVKLGFTGRGLQIRKLLALQAVAADSIGIDEGAVAISQEISLLVAHIQLLAAQIETVIKGLIELVNSLPESRYMLSIQGLGYLTVAGILAGLGPLSNYTNGRQLIKMAGMNPTQKESAGKSSRHTPISKQGRSSLRWCLWPALVALLRHNADFRTWAKARQERAANAHPLHRREVIGAAINRLLHLVFALVKKQSFYRIPQTEMALVAN